MDVKSKTWWGKDTRDLAIKVRQRLRVIEKLLIEGATVPTIIEYAEKNNWGVKQRMLYYYVRKIKKEWIRKIEKDSNNIFNLHIKRRERLYEKAISNNELQIALNILQDIARLQQLYDNKIRLDIQIPETFVDILKLAMEKKRAGLQSPDMKLKTWDLKNEKYRTNIEYTDYTEISDKLNKDKEES